MAIADPTGARTTARASRKRRQRTAPTPPLLDAFAPPPVGTRRAPMGSRTLHAPVEHPPAQWDARGYRRPPQTIAGYEGKSPGSKGKKYPRNPPTIGETIRLINACEDTPHGRRRRALIFTLWRTGIRINEARNLLPSDLREPEGLIIVRHGKGDKQRVVSMDAWGWQQLRPWINERRQGYPPGELFCVLDGPTAGRAWAASCFRRELHNLGLAAGIDKRCHPHMFRHAFATERDREGVDVKVIQKQLGHASPHITYRYISEMSTEDLVDEARARQVPAVPANEVMTIMRGLL